MQNAEIYLIPGLGFDCRIFRNLNLDAKKIYSLNWITPERNETLAHYAARMSAGFINNPASKIIIGHSFGGIVAQEIAKIHAVEKIILLSSIKSGKENTRFFQMVNYLGLYHFFSKKIVLLTFPLWAKSHGYISLEHRRLFVDMIKKTTNRYLQWALRELSLWESNRMPENTAIIQIHGENDRTFPIGRLEEPVIRIPAGNHFMVYDMATLISELIRKELYQSDNLPV